MSAGGASLFSDANLPPGECACDTTDEGWRPCPTNLCERPDHLAAACHIDPARAVEQRESFDCMTAVLATIFGCPYEEAPMLADPNTGDPVDQWLAVMTAWLKERGFWPQSFGLTNDIIRSLGDEIRSPWYWPTLWMGGVRSPRYDGEHAVVMRGSDVVWDPHPRREMGHLGFTSAEVFLPVDPAKLVVRSAA